MIVAIDPGVNGIGWARFDERELVACGYAPLVGARPAQGAFAAVLDSGRAYRTAVVIERPRVYGGRAARGDTQDLLDLSIVVGQLAALAELATGITAELIFPRDWKGTRSKRVDHPLTVSRLSETERLHLSECRAPGSLLHNVTDAIGIGLWKVGRR